VKVILAGSRTITDPALLEVAIARSGFHFHMTEVFSGGARGVDALGEGWAHRLGLPIRRFLADWRHLGSFAGPERNGRMARAADALVLVWDGRSRGSADMLAQAHREHLHIHELVAPRDVEGCEAYVLGKHRRMTQRPIGPLRVAADLCPCVGCFAARELP
jgi:hypothetical protein